MSRAVAVLVLLVAGTTVATADVKETTVQYKHGDGSTNGYASVWFNARYAFHACQGELLITTELVGKLQVSSSYWFDGVRYEVPPGLSPTVDDQGTFNGRVRNMYRSTWVGSFKTLAGRISGHGCLGDTEKIASLAELGLDAKDRSAVESYLMGLTVFADENPPYRDVNVESWIRHKLDRERREKEIATKPAEPTPTETKPVDGPVPDGPPDTPADTAPDTRPAASPTTTTTAAPTTSSATPPKESYEDHVRARANDNKGCYWVDKWNIWHEGPRILDCSPEIQKIVWDRINKQEARAAEIKKKNREQIAAAAAQERQAEQTRATMQALSGGTPEGAMVVGAAAAVGVLGESLSKGITKATDALPASIDLEATQRITFSGNTGNGFSFRAPGFFYTHMGFVSYELGSWKRAFAGCWGLGIQLPLTWRWTLRPLELGINLASVRHILDESTLAASFNIRTGAVLRIASGLALSTTIGFDTLENQGFADVGLMWRFDIGKGDKRRRYLVR